MRIKNKRRTRRREGRQRGNKRLDCAGKRINKNFVLSEESKGRGWGGTEENVNTTNLKLGTQKA